MGAGRPALVAAATSPPGGVELDAIAGAVLRAGVRHRLNCATIAALRDQIQARAGAAAPGG
jgi:hypothetical protein